MVDKESRGDVISLEYINLRGPLAFDGHSGCTRNGNLGALTPLSSKYLSIAEDR